MIMKERAIKNDIFTLKDTITVKCLLLRNINFTAQLIDRQTYKKLFLSVE